MVKIKSLVIIFFCAFTINGYGQNCYIVFFTDKDNTPYSIDTPEEFLSQRALVRRAKQNIDITIDDLPVDPAYVNGLRDAGPEVYFLSKWMNAALIQTEPELLENILALNFVDSVALAAPGAKLSRNSRKYEVREEGKETENVTDGQLSMLGLDLLHEQGLNGQGILMAFLDGGFKGVNSIMPFEHIYQDNRLLYTLNLVENDDNVYQYSVHGTQVLSTVAGLIPDEYTGGAYGADFMLFVTEESPTEYRIEEYNWLIAAEKADSAGADIISTSLGYFEFDDPSMNYEYKDMDGETTLITRAANFATERGIVVVVSAGNEGNRAWHYITSPADGFNVISVGSINSMLQISPFSSYGPSSDARVKPEVVALGSSATVIDDSGRITTNDGTSFAAPLVAGLAAVLWQQYPNLSALELRELIINNASRNNMPDGRFGYGIAGYQYIISGLLPGDKREQISVFPNPVASDEIKINLKNFNGPIRGILYDRTGKALKVVNVLPTVSGHYQPISLAHINPGIYMLQLTVKGKAHGFKIVKY